MSDIKVNIIGEFNKKGFDDADKATKKLTRSFQKLGATIGVALSARAFFNFAKQGAIAFAAEEKAIKQLTNSLANLGFAYSVPGIERYLEATERATMVTKEEMRPAIANLITTTMDAEQSMKLLATAIDASVETGQDLTSVTTAITRAYAGNYASLAKLTRGYSSAQLKALGFEKSVQILSDRFQGSAAASADTYSFKIAQFEKAVGDAQKAIGEGLIKSIEQLGSGDYDEGLQDLVDIGNQIGVAFQYAAGAAQTLKEAYDFITLRGVRDLTMDLLGKNQPGRGGSTTPTQFELAKANVQRQKELTLQKKIIAERKKAAALTDKEKKNQLALNRAKSVFDLEKIQIEAALKGKITEEERVRLQLMKAIANENVDKAEELTKKLKEVQEETAKIAKQLLEFPEANDPFINWTKSLNGVSAQLSAISQKKVVVDFITNYTSTATNSAAASIAAAAPTSPAAVIAAATSPAAVAAQAAKEAEVAVVVAEAATAAAEAATATAEAIVAQTAAAEAMAAAVTVEEVKAAEVFVKAAEEAAVAAIVQTEAAVALETVAATLTKEVAPTVSEIAIAATEAATATAEAITAQVAAAEVLAAAVLPEEIKAAEIFVKAADEAAAAAIVQTEAAAALEYVAATLAAETALAEATQAEQVAEILAAEFAFNEASAALADASQLFDLSVLGAYSAGVPSVEINVTVEGNVTAEQDLAEKIYDTFLGYQKSGKGLIYQAVAI